MGIIRYIMYARNVAFYGEFGGLGMAGIVADSELSSEILIKSKMGKLEDNF